MNYSAGTIYAEGKASGFHKIELTAEIYYSGVLERTESLTGEAVDGKPSVNLSVAVNGGRSVKFIMRSKDGKILCTAEKHISYSDEEFNALLEKWRTFLTGGENINFRSERISERVSSIETEALTLQRTMDKSTNAASLWGTDYTASSHMTVEYGKIYKMALAWGTYGQSLYHNEALKDDILYAVEWMYQNRYGRKEIAGNGWRDINIFNWWDWFVGTPKYMLDTMIIMGDVFRAEDIDKYLELYEHVLTIMRTDMSDRSHINSRAYNLFAACALKRDSARIEELMQLYPVLFETVKSGTGMYADGSYVDHNNIAYTGVYGTGAVLDRVVKIMSITAGTPFELPQMNDKVYENWIYNVFEPLMIQGGVMNMVRGRAVDTSSEYTDGIMVIQSMLDMLDYVSEEDELEFKLMIQKHMKGSGLTYMYNNLGLPQIARLEEILSEELPAVSENTSSRVYNNMDRIVHHRENYHVGIAMSSSRIANYESISGCNLKGWYTGDGMFYVYTAADQFDKAYFQNADPYKRPGTTVDTQEREAASIAYGYEYFSSQDFVGGVNLENKYTVGAMSLESFHNDVPSEVKDSSGGISPPVHECDLTAKKSWFLFDDEIVALGADINATGESEVITVAENHKMPAGAYIDGNEITKYGSGVKENASWAVIEGVGGYYFPEKSLLNYKKVKNSGDYFEMWFSHGAAPSDKTYEYVVLPSKTAEETKNYAENPTIEIISNSESVQAVRQTEQNITGYVFWTSGVCQGIEAYVPMTVMMRQGSNEIKLAFSDPTHKQRVLKLKISGEYEIGELPDEISCEVKNGETLISCIPAENDGRSFEITLYER